MPTYDYTCDKCNNSFEQWQSFKEDKLIKCPKCKKNSLRRLFGVPFVYVKQEPKTIGELAESNSKKFGREECQERELKASDEYQQARKSAGVPIKKKKDSVPWWRSGKTDGLDRSDKPLEDKKLIKYKKDIAKLGSNFQDNVKVKKGKKNGK